MTRTLSGALGQACQIDPRAPAGNARDPSVATVRPRTRAASVPQRRRARASTGRWIVVLALVAAVNAAPARAHDVCPAETGVTYERVGETLVIRGRPSRPTVGGVDVDPVTGVPALVADTYGLYRPDVVVTSSLPDTMPELTLTEDDRFVGGRVGGDLPDTMPTLAPSPSVGVIESTGADGIWTLPG